MEPLLQVTNLTKYFGSLPAIQQVHLEINPGQVIGLAGRSGAGKTVLAMLLASLYSPDEGEMIFDGNPCHWPFHARKLGIEVIHQRPELVEMRDICDNIFLGLEIGRPVRHSAGILVPQRQMDTRASEILQELGLPFHSVHERVSSLSSEERQLVSIARSMVQPSRLMIVDNPTALLNYASQQKLLNLIQTWQREGRAVLFCSDNLDHLFAVTDEIIVLRKGVRVSSFRTDEISREEVVSALVGTTDQQQITPIIWALDSYYRARERAEKLLLDQTSLEQNLAAKDMLNRQLIDQLNEQVQALDQANLALQDAHRRLLTQREYERKRLARDIHDQTIQDLLSVNYQLETVEGDHTVNPDVASQLQAIRNSIRKLVEDLRQLCGSLRPPTIDSLGLGAAITSYVNEWSEREKVVVTLEIDNNLGRLPEAIELSVFRIVQEGLRNIAKHARASQVQVQLKHSSPRTLILSIGDNGRGLPGNFDLSKLSRKGHFGLLGISERVALLGGHLDLKNQPSSGLLLQTEIPHPRSSLP